MLRLVGLLQRLRIVDYIPWWAPRSDWWWALIVTKGVAGLPSAMIVKIVILLLSGCLLEAELLDHGEERHNFLNNCRMGGQLARPPEEELWTFHN